MLESAKVWLESADQARRIRRNGMLPPEVSQRLQDYIAECEANAAQARKPLPPMDASPLS